MPIYEYKCLECGKSFEVLQSISSKPLQSCIHCQGRVKKLISAAAFRFSGPGFYSNDYKRQGSEEKTGERQVKSDKKDNKNANT